MKLTPENVDAVLKDCFLRTENEIPREEVLEIDSVRVQYGFHPGRVENNAASIKDMLAQLDPKFAEGWSFLNIPFLASGEQWGEHRNADALVALGLAAGFIDELLPAQMNKMMPGGVPFIFIKKVVFESEDH